jgi:hypothetical protein
MQRLSDGRVVLMDLGLASSSEVTRMTRTGFLVGTLLYMAPEVVQGGEYTPAADVYQLGSTLWELLTGVPMIATKAVDDSFSQILEGVRPEVDVAALGIPEDLWAAIRMATDVDPARRPARARDFERILQGGELGHGGSSSPLLPGGKLDQQPGSGSGRSPSTLLAVLGVLGVAAGFALTAGSGPPEDVRWRVVGGAVVVETAPGGPEDLRVEVDGEVSSARFHLLGGRRRAIVPGIGSDREWALRIFWDGGQGPVQHLRGEPEALGPIEFGGPELLSLHARRTCQVGFGGEGARLWTLAPGRHPLPAPPRSVPSFHLRWVEDGVTRSREVLWSEVFRSQAERLIEQFEATDPHATLLEASEARKTASVSLERSRWEPALPWLPAVLRDPAVPVPTRRRLHRVFQAWQRSVAEERFVGGSAPALALPERGPGGRLWIRVHEDDPEEPPPLDGVPIDFDPGGCPQDPTEGPKQYVLATEFSRHVRFGSFSHTCAGVSWRWPDLGVRASDPVRLWIRTPRMPSRAVFRLVLGDGSDDLRVELWRPVEQIEAGSLSFRGWAGITLPADLWPRSGQLVSLQLVDLHQPRATIAKLRKIRIHGPIPD